MTTPIDANTLLRVLGSGVVPTDRTPTSPDARGLDFARLLDQARTGQIRSGMQVTVDPQLDVAFDAEELEQLSQAADLAEAQGIERVLVVRGDERLVLDVQRRSVSAEAATFDGQLHTGFGGLLELPAASDDATDAGTSSFHLAGDRLLNLLKSAASSGL